MKNIPLGLTRTITLAMMFAMVTACGNSENAAVQESEDVAVQDDACAGLYLTNGRFFSMAELPQNADGVTESDFNSMRIVDNVINEVGDDLVVPDCAEKIDLGGNSVIPGFIDTHMHFIRATLRPGYDTREMELSRSITEAMEMVAAKSAAMTDAGVPTDQWITFIGGWDPIQWDENPAGSGRPGGPARVFPTLEQMDNAAGDYPFYIHLRSTEEAYANSLGIARLNELAANSPDEGDPMIDPATGFVADSTTSFRLLKQDSDQRDQAVRVMKAFNSVGLTSVRDVGGSIRGIGAQHFDVFTGYETMKTLYDADELTIRVRALVQGDIITPLADYEALTQSIAADFGSEDDSMFKIIGLGEDLGDIATNGYQKTAEMALSNGWLVGKHGGWLEDIDNYHAAAQATGNLTRLTLEHATPGQAEFDRIRELGYEDNVGTVLAGLSGFLGRGAAGTACNYVPYRTILEEGFRAGIGTDSTNAQSSNPWINIYHIVTGKDVKGFAFRAGGVTTAPAGGGAGGMGMGIGGGGGAMGAMGAPANAAAAGAPVEITCPDERISRTQAIQLYTKGGSWLAVSEDQIGTLEEGKLADLVVLSDDIFSDAVSDDEIIYMHSLLTIVDGKVVYVNEDAAFATEVNN